MTLETDDLQGHSSETSVGDRLTSWKEIAAYLKCSESTVRRWEDEGMPVHRHPHKKRSAIYAYRAEIDAWWNDGHVRLAELARTHVEQRLLRWLVAASAALLLLLTGTYLARTIVRLGGPERPAVRSEWVQITNFPDSVSQPALSPDGRMLAFLRSPSTFVEESEVYVKLLPEGDPVQLTRDGTHKMMPVFSPDGSRIAYTVQEGGLWDTWLVPVLGGKPELWLSNASGLTWVSKQRLLFSEIKTGPHMAIVTALENHADSRDIYVPAHESSMAHKSYLSPDGKWVLIVEHQRNNVWMRCRLATFEGKSARQVGPQGPCTAAAWSPDGKWMYLSANAGDSYHLWRQRFPDGNPEQLTAGPTEEEGIAMSPDGRSLITAVGLRQRAIWFHDTKGDRQVSLEGYAFSPRVSSADQKVYYRITKGYGGFGTPSELWSSDLASATNEAVLPGFRVIHFDVSEDGRLLVCALDAENKPRMWLARPGRRSPPRQIGRIEADQALFGPNGVIFFLATEGNHHYLFQVNEDGSGLQKIPSQPFAGEIHSVSPDGQWVSAWGPIPGREGASFDIAYPTAGGSPVGICSPPCYSQWSPDGKYLYVSVFKGFMTGFARGRTFALPTRPGTMFPNMPVSGFRSEGEMASVRGVRVIEAADFHPGRGPEVYVYSRENIQRNLYRIPIRR